MPKAVIVGAGINGLCTARGLLRRGWQVEVVERGPVPNPQAASWDRHRLIRAAYGEPALVARVGTAFAAWDGLWRDLGASHYVERGVLSLSRLPGDAADRLAEGAGERLEPAEVARRFPMLATEGLRFGLWNPRGGALMADRILEGLADWLAARGVTFHAEAPVSAIDRARGEVTVPGGTLTGDVVIAAAGCGLPALVPDLAGDLVPHRCVVLYVRPGPAWASDWATGPAWCDLGGDDELWGLPPMAGIAMKIGCGRHTRPGDPADPAGREVTEADRAAILGAYAGRFRGAAEMTVESALAAFFLVAPGERFVLRADRRLVVLSADSGHGFKFGPLTGEAVAEAVAEDGLDALARDFAAGRA